MHKSADKPKNLNKGFVFEKLVECLLKYMYPGITFHHTSYHNDGGKDFYSVSIDQSETIWVEAKNYQQHLELSKFAKTFIMADVHEINKIIIFSVSELTEPTKINVGRYAALHNKTISVFAGKDILKLLKHYRSEKNLQKYYYLLNNFDGKFESTEEISSLLPVRISYAFYPTKQLNLTFRRNLPERIGSTKNEILPLGSYVAQEICLTNPNLLKPVTIVFDRDFENASPLELVSSEMYPDKVLLPAASTTVIVIYYKVVGFRENVSLPAPKFVTENIVAEEADHKVTCAWLAEIPLIGHSYVQLNGLLQTLDSAAGSTFSMVYGKNGVGKSRFLRELSLGFYQRSKTVISADLMGMQSLSLKILLKKVLTPIYSVDFDMAEDGCRSALKKENSPLYHLFYEENFHPGNETIEDLSNILSDLFDRNQIVLLIDNAQEMSEEITEFFLALIKKVSLKNNSHVCFSFNLDMLFPEQAPKFLFDYLSRLNACYKIRLNDFSENEALLYLREMTESDSVRPELDDYYERIIRRFGTNPLTLRQLVLYLKQEHIIDFHESNVYISDLSRMQTVLDELPNTLNEILEFRYKSCLHENSNQEIIFNRFAWLLLFLGPVSTQDSERFGFSEQTIRKLVLYGFIERNENSEWSFSHQLIEKFFCARVNGDRYVKFPRLQYLKDDEFLLKLRKFLSETSIRFCVEIMLLDVRLLNTGLSLRDAAIFENAFHRLRITTPRALLLPMICAAFQWVSEQHPVAHVLELQTAYRLCISCQERFDNVTAAVISKDLVCFEQSTYQSKLDANAEFVSLFKHYAFLLSGKEKTCFLQWLETHAIDFRLSQRDYLKLKIWIHTRFSKNYGELHQFEDAGKHVRSALESAQKMHDLGALAEAEIEYGNSYAYTSPEETAKHWTKCADYIGQMTEKSVYYQIYELGYGILAGLLTHENRDFTEDIRKLCNLRKETFLYQQLFIDDVYADYKLINFVEKNSNPQELKDLLVNLNIMLQDSYRYHYKFTFLAEYKLLTTYMLLAKTDSENSYEPSIRNFMIELASNGIFSTEKFEYSKMLLNDIALHFYSKHEEIPEWFSEKISSRAKDYLRSYRNALQQGAKPEAITVLSDRNRRINLLHFNYVF